jgi:O-antigen ligase
MGLEYFVQRPWTGWGDTSWINSTNSIEFINFSSQFTRELPKHGFHNEIVTSSVRSGIWGLIASFNFFAVVFYLAIMGIRMKTNKLHKHISITLLVVIVHLFFAGLSTELTNLTFLSAFIGIVLSVMLGEKMFIEENRINRD